MRCSWGSSLGMEAAGSLYDSRHCNASFCRQSELSADAYQEFLLSEALSANIEMTLQITSEDLNTTQLMHHEHAQCIFFDEAGPPTDANGNLCSCSYLPLSAYCSMVHYGTTIEEVFIGDSTMTRLKETIARDCALINSITPVTSTNLADPITTKLVVVNDDTLHSLYLPFARESDVPMVMHGTGTNTTSKHNMLKHSTTSISDFKSSVSQHIERALQQHDTPNTIWVYMSNDMVCPDAFIRGYHEAWRFLKRELNGSRLDSVSHRRGTDRTAGLAFTLDYYGSSFAAELAARHVSQAYPGFRLLKMRPSIYPAVCLLTSQGDGRHFEKQQFVYYVLKARLLLHLIADQVGGHVNTAAEKVPT